MVISDYACAPSLHVQVVTLCMCTSLAIYYIYIYTVTVAHVLTGGPVDCSWCDVLSDTHNCNALVFLAPI